MNSMYIEYVPGSIDISLEMYRLIVKITENELYKYFYNKSKYKNHQGRTHQLIVATTMCQNIENRENRYLRLSKGLPYKPYFHYY